MAKPCRYRLPGQDTWMSEDEFKKSLADGLLDKFAIDDKIAVRNFKPDTTAAEKFRVVPQTDVKADSGVTLNGKKLTIQEAIDLYKEDIKELESKERTLSVDKQLDNLYESVNKLEAKQRPKTQEGVLTKGDLNKLTPNEMFDIYDGLDKELQDKHFPYGLSINMTSQPTKTRFLSTLRNAVGQEEAVRLIKEKRASKQQNEVTPTSGRELTDGIHEQWSDSFANGIKKGFDQLGETPVAEPRVVEYSDKVEASYLKEDANGNEYEFTISINKNKNGSLGSKVTTSTTREGDLPQMSKPTTQPTTEVKESGYSPTDNLFNNPELTKNKTHGWRTMDEKEFNSLSSGEKTYEGGAPKAGNWIAGVPESAAKFGKKGAVMVEFGGIDIEGGENMSKGSTADKSNVTKVWRYNNETKKFEEAPELLDKVKKSEKIGEPKSKAKTEKQINNQINSLLDDLKDLDDDFGTISMVTDANGNINVDELLNAYNDKNLALEDTLSNSQNKVIKEIKSLKEQLRPKAETKKEEVQKDRVTIPSSEQVTRFTQQLDLVRNEQGEWEYEDKEGKKIVVNAKQQERAEKAFQEQQTKEGQTTREKIEKAFDSLKIDTKGKALSIPIPPGIYNAIIEGAKNLVLAGLDVTVAVKQAVDQVVKNAKAKNEITDKEADEIRDYVNYANNGEFIEKAKEAAEGQERVSGIKKGLTSEESQEIASDAIQKMTIKEALDAGQNAIESGEVVPDKLINSIINVKGRPLSAVETAAMVYYKANLDNDLSSEYEKLNKALSLNDSIAEADAKAEIARLQDKIAEYEVMANITGYQQGLSLRLRSMMLNSEYDLVKQKAKIKSQYGGKIPADVEKRLNELDKELRDVNAKLSELEKKRNATESEEVVKNIKDTKESSNKSSAVSKDGKIKIPTSEIKKAVLNGANTIDEVVDAVRDLVKKQFPNATDRQIRDAITNYGRSQSQSKDEIQKKINEMKRVGRLLSKLEDVQNGIKKTKNKVKRDALTEKERELKEQIKEELSKIPLTDEEIADIQAEKLSNLKKRTEQSIRDFEKKISSGDFDKKKRSPLLELDAEAAKLKAKREEIKFKFDLEFEKAKERNKDWGQKFYEGLIRSISAPKGLIASLDFSAPFRQGAIFVLTQNPKKTLSQLGKQFQFWWSEKSYNEWLSGVKSSEYYPLMKASGLYIAEENAKLTAAEEAFMTNFMSKIPLFGKPKVFKSGKKLWGADIYGRAERAYTGFLNNLRVQAFLDVAEKMADSGISPKTNIDEYKSWADYVNNATGRGTGSKNKVGTAFEVSAPALSAVFFSPRFLWSRLNITGVNPSMYVRMSPTARKQAIKRTLGFFGAASTILGISAFLLSLDDDDETKVELDPRSSDFGKIRIGNTRIDILAGTQQVYRTLAQAVAGEKKNIATGKLEELGKKYGGQTRGDVITTFFTNKLSPTASIGYKSLWLSEPEKEARKEEGEKEGENDLKSMFIDLTVPLYLQDIKKLSKDHGAGMTTFLTLMSINGIGVQNIAPKEPKSQSDSSSMKDFEDEFKGFEEEFDMQKEFENEFKFD